MADRVLQITFELRPDLWLAFSEEHRHEVLLDATDQFRDLLRQVLDEERPDQNNMWSRWISTTKPLRASFACAGFLRQQNLQRPDGRGECAGLGDAIADCEVTPEYALKHLSIIGDPPECIRRLRALWEETGGFGTLLMIAQDWDDWAKWVRSTWISSVDRNRTVRENVVRKKLGAMRLTGTAAGVTS
jgi:hypothetical protein